MLGTELVFRKTVPTGKFPSHATLTQSLGTFLFVSLVFGVIFRIIDIPVYLAFAFGGIAPHHASPALCPLCRTPTPRTCQQTPCFPWRVLG